MTWNAFHNRGEILRVVMSTADARLDGVLPWDAPGARENFRDDLDLLSALMLKWHARLSGNMERELAKQPLDPPLAIAIAWRRTADALPGTRRIIDHYNSTPHDDYMAGCLEKAARLEWTRLALAAGLAHYATPAAARAGEQIELLARTLTEIPPIEEEIEEPQTFTGALVSRLRSVLAA